MDIEGQEEFHGCVVCVGNACSDPVIVDIRKKKVIGLNRQSESIGIKLEVVSVSAFERVDNGATVVIKQALHVVGPSSKCLGGRHRIHGLVHVHDR